MAIKSFHPDPARPNAACSNITVSGCTFLHGHGVSIGSETLGGVSGVVVEHCTFEGTRYGFRIKSSRGRGGVVQDVRVNDIQMHDVDPAIDIMCYYPNPPMGDVPPPMAFDTPVYRHIHIENLTATCPREAGSFHRTAGKPDHGRDADERACFGESAVHDRATRAWCRIEIVGRALRLPRFSGGPVICIRPSLVCNRRANTRQAEPPRPTIDASGS